MASFTTISTGSNLQSHGYLNEIETAISNRLSVAGAIGNGKATWRIDDDTYYTWPDSKEIFCTYYSWNGSGWVQRFRESTGQYPSGNRIHAGGTLKYGPVQRGTMIFELKSEWGWYDDEGDGTITARQDPYGQVGTCTYAETGEQIGITPTAAGDNIQEATFWSNRQEAIGEIVDAGVESTHWFMDLGSYGSFPSSVPSYTNSTPASIPLLTLGSQVWSKVTNGHTLPRRRTTMSGYPSSGWLYGYCQRGDIIQVEGSTSPWLIEDLQDALRFLYATLQKTSQAAGTHAPQGGDPFGPLRWNYDPHNPPYSVREWNGDISTFYSSYAEAKERHDHDLAFGSISIDAWPIEAVPVPNPAYLSSHIMSRFVANKSGVGYIYQLISRNVWGTATIPTYSGLRHKADVYFLPEIPDSWLGAVMAFFDVNDELADRGVTAVNRLTRVLSDSSWVTSAARSASWNGSNTDSYFDLSIPEGTLLFDQGISFAPPLPDITSDNVEWHGYQLSVDQYSTLEWDWQYN